MKELGLVRGDLGKIALEAKLSRRTVFNALTGGLGPSVATVAKVVAAVVQVRENARAVALQKQALLAELSQLVA